MFHIKLEVVFHVSWWRNLLATLYGSRALGFACSLGIGAISQPYGWSFWLCDSFIFYLYAIIVFIHNLFLYFQFLFNFINFVLCFCHFYYFYLLIYIDR